MKLLIGPPNSGKSQRLLARFLEALEARNVEAYFVVPSTRSADVVGERIKSMRPGISGNLPWIVTFPQLYERILSGLGFKPDVMTALQRARLLGDVIGDLAEEGMLEYFAATADRPGLVNAVGGLIDEFWQSGTDPKDFARFAEGRSAKDRDLATIFSHYASALDQLNLADVEGLGFLAAQRLQSGLNQSDKRSAKARNIAARFSFIGADGFDFYTPVQVSLLASLSRAGVETAATLAFEEDRAVHLWQQPTFRRFQSAGAEIIKCAFAPSTYIEKRAAVFLEEDESASPPTPEKRSTIQRISAPDRAEEVRAAAREIKRLVLEENVPLEEVTVVCRSLALYCHYIERIFAECAIPARIDAPLALSEAPLIVAILNLLNLSNINFRRREMVEFLRSPYFDLTPFGIDEAAADLLDCLTMERNVPGGIDLWLKVVEDAGAGANESSPAEGLRKLFEVIRLPRAAPRKQYLRAIKRILHDLGVEERIAAGPNAARDREAYNAFHLLLDNVLVEHLAALAAQRSDRPVTWARLFAEIQRGAAQTALQRPAVDGPAVLVQELRTLLPRTYRVIFIFGLVEGEFPARLAERAPYSLFERQELLEAGIDLSETTEDAGADLMQFYKVMSRARERLYLSSARTDIAGGELLPSYLLEEVGPAVDIVLQQSPADSPRPASLEELAHQVARHIARHSREERSIRFLQAEELLMNRLPAWAAARRGAYAELDRLARPDESPFAGIISDAELVETLRRRFGPRYLWSATQLNDYGTCPFRFFARNALKLAFNAEPGEGFAANELGNAYHKILEVLYRRIAGWPEGVSGRSEEELDRLIFEVSEPVFAEMLEKGVVRQTALWEYEKAEVRERLLNLLLADADWNATRPIALERHFGEHGTAPLRIKGHDGDILIRGVIDRIDEGEEGLIVIDYKTSSSPIQLRDALMGRNLQLPIYMLAARDVIQPGGRVSGGYYLHIYSGKKGSPLPSRRNDEVTAEAVMNQAEEYIRDYASKARCGKFPVRPNGDCFSNCKFDTACRIRMQTSALSDES